MTNVEIPTDSNLQIIKSNAFYNSKINEIFIPSKISTICEGALAYCEYLTRVEIASSMNSNLLTIERCAFYRSEINEIIFPSNLIELKEGWCNGTDNLINIVISPSNGQFKFF